MARLVPRGDGRIRAQYLVETAHDVRRAVEMMAGEQSSGTFVKIPGETPELQARHGAHVESVEMLGPVEAPSLPGSRPPKGAAQPGIMQAEVVLSWPFENVGDSLTTLWTTVAGNLFELSPFSGLRLLDIEIPASFMTRYPGGKFGVPGTRALAGVHDRPIIGTIIKPSVGFSAAQTAELVSTLIEAGLDFIKDDELQTNSPHSPLAQRVDSVMRVINDYAQRTGRRPMFAFNVTGDLDDMRRGHDLVLEAGGTCIMVNMIAVGLAGVIELARHSQLPIHGHRAGWGMLTRAPALGMDYIAFQKFFRLAGVDHLHVNGIRNKFCESDASVIAAARECLTPMLGGYTVMPVFSSGQTAAQAPDTYAALGSADCLYLCGGGIIGHPIGIAAGVDSVREAWHAAMQGIPLTRHAEGHPALAAALSGFSGGGA
jgi:ribulose-bisphosphate carboxylase large chain